ncbi:MAG: methyl-accepting chemotaxis protein [Rhizobiaceae bacterium]
MPEQVIRTTQSVMRSSLARTGRWASGVAFAGGLVADVLNPLAPFAAYIALAGAVAALVIAIAVVLKLTVMEKALPALVFSTTIAAISGGLYTLQQQADAEDGLLAALVPAVAELQRDMGIVVAKVEEIQQTVEETQKTVEETKVTVEEVRKSTEAVETGTRQIAESQARQEEKTDRLTETAEKVEEQTRQMAESQAAQQEATDKIAESTEKIALTIETIANGFETLAQQGGIIANPTRPDEHYHNARVHELGGDMLNARRSYLAFAEFDVDAVDPYIRFATLLRVQDGRGGAREVFGALAAKTKAPSIKLVHALQFEDQQRLPKLEAFVAENPDYGPAWYLLSEEFSEDKLGFQTLADKRREAEALTRFRFYETDGGLLKYFIDHTLLADWLERSKNRLAALGDVLDPSLFLPKIIPMRSNADWMITVSLPEAATGLSWRLGTEGPFTDTGFMATIDQRTGKPMPNPSFALPDSTPPGIIGITYLDIRGRQTGPFDIRFDPMAMLAEQNKQLLEQFWTSWIAFDASGNRGLVYYSHLLSYRCAIGAVRYGFNGGAPEQALDIPPCDPDDPYALPDNFLPYFKVGEEVTSMSVQISYTDGTQSPVREFRR